MRPTYALLSIPSSSHDYPSENSALVLTTSQTTPKWEKFLCVLLFVSGFFGFHVFLFAGLAFSLPSRLFTSPVRALTLGLALLVFLFWSLKRLPMYRGKVWAVLLLFWLLYGLRIFADRGNMLLLDGIGDYIIFGFGTCLLPMLGFMCRFSPGAMRWGLWGMLVSGSIACGLASLIYRSLFQGHFGRIQGGQLVGDATAVSPLTLSYLASAYIVLGIYLLFERTNIPSSTARKLLPFLIVAIGTVPLLLGASRGSLLAIAIPVSTLLLARANSARDLVTVFTAAIVVIGMGAWLYFNASSIGSDLVARMMTIGSDIEAGQTSAHRMVLYELALRQFMDSPLLGSGLVIDPFGSYPHNIIIESFMATGIVGGILFTVFAMTCLWRAVKLLRSRSRDGWVAMLFLHYFVLGQLSSSIAAISYFWISAAAVLAAHAGLNQHRLRTRKHMI